MKIIETLYSEHKILKITKNLRRYVLCVYSNILYSENMKKITSRLKANFYLADKTMVYRTGDSYRSKTVSSQWNEYFIYIII